MVIPSVKLVPLSKSIFAEEALIFLTFEGEKSIQRELARVFKKDEVEKLVSYVAKRKFDGKLKQITHLPFADDTMVVMVGLGSEKDVNLEQYRKAACASLGVLKQLNIQSAGVIPAKTAKAKPQDIAVAVSEGIVLGAYEFDRYKPKDKNAYRMEGVTIALDSVTKASEDAVAKSLVVCDGVYFARDLENEFSDKVTPASFAGEVVKIAKELKLSYKIIEGENLVRQKLNLIHAVGRGAVVPPRLILLEYNGSRKAKVDVALVGKGITFDTGGINLKPAGFINQMHIDMAGAATVLATMALAARLKMKKHLVGAMALAENAIGSGSYKPGSIIVSHSGKTVEIANTDAEGRLVLADALSYTIKKYEPAEVIDLATLTGAILVALGSSAAGIFGNDPKMVQRLIESGARTHERLWEMPLYPEYLDETKGTHSDLKNLGSKMNGGFASSSVAAIFLQQFVGDTKWAHLDIAGTAIVDNQIDYMPKNGTGFGVRLLMDYLG